MKFPTISAFFPNFLPNKQIKATPIELICSQTLVTAVLWSIPKFYIKVINNIYTILGVGLTPVAQLPYFLLKYVITHSKVLIYAQRSSTPQCIVHYI